MSVDITTKYLGMSLKSPIVASAGPLTERVDMLHRLEEAGIGAVVMPSLFEEQIEHEAMEMHRLQDFGTEGFSEALDYFPQLSPKHPGPQAYLRRIEELKQAVSIPLIASLNGSSSGGWTSYAKQMEQAGADGIELNIYYLSANPSLDSATVEARYLDLVAAVRAAITIPLAVKIGSQFTSPVHLACQIVSSGADGIVLFNRFLQADIDLESLMVVPRLELSNSYEVLLPLRWIAIMREHINASLAASGGVHSGRDVIKLLLAGADVVMTTSALLQSGPELVRTMLTELSLWMIEHQYESITQLKGSMSLQNCPNPAEFERANYVKALISYTGNST
jgi:dihydroorotate dehydrogenase (fumarate)